MASRPAAGRTAKRSRMLATIAIAAAAATASACAPIQTQIPFAPSDGARMVIDDDLRVENLLVLTGGEGEAALVVGALTNATDEATDVTLNFGEQTTSVPVGAGATVLLDPANAEGELVVIDAIAVPPGATLPIAISTPSAGSSTLEVPVLDGTLEPYGEYLEYLP